LDVRVDDAGGSHPCARSGARIVCPGAAGNDVWLAIETERVFNMERRCLRVSPPLSGALVIASSLPARTLGIGLTDKARFARGAPLHARFEPQGADPFELVVDDKFETTSKVKTLDKAAPFTVSIERGADQADNRSACLTAAP
ncbi:MAG TPA: hypothetical protein VGO62_22170, partial [Myxococcota bacterium]